MDLKSQFALPCEPTLPTLEGHHRHQKIVIPHREFAIQDLFDCTAAKPVEGKSRSSPVPAPCKHAGPLLQPQRMQLPAVSRKPGIIPLLRPVVSASWESTSIATGAPATVAGEAVCAGASASVRGSAAASPVTGPAGSASGPSSCCSARPRPCLACIPDTATFWLQELRPSWRRHSSPGTASASALQKVTVCSLAEAFPRQKLQHAVPPHSHLSCYETKDLVRMNSR